MARRHVRTFGLGIPGGTGNQTYTFKVPANVYFMNFDGVGGGGGGGGGAGGTTSFPGNGGAGGGGSRRGRYTNVPVVPGETITVVCGGGGAGGVAGAAGGGTGLNGGDGTDSTVTGSISGLLATFVGAQGGTYGSYASGTAGYSIGGQGVKNIYRNSNVGVVLGTSYVQFIPVANQGGSTPAGANSSYATVLMTGGGSTVRDVGGYGASGFNCLGGGGGSSDWPGNVPGDGNAANNAGIAGTLGAGGSGGSGRYSTVNGVGWVGGVGGVGVVEASWDA